jgi:single-strand DNA-binding protein
VSLNKVQIIGHLGADPETRETQGGTQVANLRIATSERQKQGEEWVDHTEWHRVVCFGRTAENVARFCTKGRQLYVEGKLRTRKWTDKDGVEKFSTEIVADAVIFLGGKGEGSGAGEAPPARGGGAARGRGGPARGGRGGGAKHSARDVGDGYAPSPDDDIPF